MHLFHFLPLLLLLLSTGVRSEDQINSVKILRNKFLKNYCSKCRPVRDQNKTLQIAFAMIFTQVLDLNLGREILSSDGIVHMRWQDEYITWNPAEYGNVTKIRFTVDEIFKPSLEVWNNGMDTYSKDRFGTATEMIAHSNGSVFWMTPITIDSQCDLNLRNYPFDEHECNISMGLSDYKLTEASFIGKDNATAVVIGPLIPNNEYRVVQLTSQTKTVDFYEDWVFSTVKITVRLQRRFTSYHYFFTMPHTLSILFCVMMFNFQIYTGTRALFAIISILLDLKVISIIIGQIGLKTFDTPIIVKHVGSNLAMIGFLLIVSILMRHNISFLYSNAQFMRNAGDSLLAKALLVRPSTVVENDLIEMIKNDQYTKIVQIDRNTLNKFTLLIQLTDRLLILGYGFLSVVLFCFWF